MYIWDRAGAEPEAGRSIARKRDEKGGGGEGKREERLDNVNGFDIDIYI